MGTIRRGVRNVIRTPLRLLLVVVLLGTSLTFAAAMVDINGSIAQKAQQARARVGNSITIRPAGVFGGGFGFGGFGAGQGAGTGRSGRSGRFGSGGRVSPPTAGTQQVAVPVVTTAQIAAIAKTPGVTSVSSQVTERYSGTALKGALSFQGFNGTFSPPPLIAGFTPGSSTATLLGGGIAKIVSGRNLRTSDGSKNVAIVGKPLATVNHLTVGSTFTLQGKKVTVVGLYSTGQRFGDNSLAMPIGAVQTLFNLKGATTVTAYTASSTQVSGVTAALQKKYGSKLDIVAGNTGFNGVFSDLQSTQNNVHTALIASLLAAALVVIFAVFLVVRERTREIGILKALGASNLKVVAQFAVEVFSTSALAAVLAVILLALFGPAIAHQFNIAPPAFAQGAGRRPFGGGFGGGGFRGLGRAFRALSGTQQLTAGLTFQTLLVILGLGIILSVIASIVPAWYVSRIRPADVLRQAAA